MAVKAGGPDPNNNSKLRDVIAKAKANNMPNDTIERGIKKAAGADSADNYEKAVYEGYGPNGVAIIVETLTDNKNRTAGNVRNAFTKGNGSIGTQLWVLFSFCVMICWLHSGMFLHIRIKLSGRKTFYTGFVVPFLFFRRFTGTMKGSCVFLWF